MARRFYAVQYTPNGRFRHDGMGCEIVTFRSAAARDAWVNERPYPAWGVVGRAEVLSRERVWDKGERRAVRVSFALAY